MHADMHPLRPFSAHNPMLDLVSLKDLHMACLWSFAGAGVVWGLRAFVRDLGKSGRKPDGKI
jgi:hypothetical protein